MFYCGVKKYPSAALSLGTEADQDSLAWLYATPGQQVYASRADILIGI